jgi:hypothetical protein
MGPTASTSSQQCAGTPEAGPPPPDNRGHQPYSGGLHAVAEEDHADGDVELTSLGGATDSFDTVRAGIPIGAPSSPDNNDTETATDGQATAGRNRRHGLPTPPGTTLARRPRGGHWNSDDVAAHLMARQPAIVRGLARRPPWAGVDDETLTELYLEAAALITRLAASGQRRDWRVRRDLERAVIAAFRHQALSHWKAVNAQMRRGDRDSTPFDPERHGAADDALARIFDDPRDELVARDWLAQLRDQVRTFWEPVILEGKQLKESGDALGLTKAQRQALYRDGIEQLARFRALAAEGLTCQLRAPAITALRAGTAGPVDTERAQAHLACCLACALVHEPGASALTRGILHVLPWPALSRAPLWLRGLGGSRAAETAGGAGTLALGKTVAALVCAGALTGGICTTALILPGALPTHRQRAAASMPQPRRHTAASAQRPAATAAATPVPSATRTPPPRHASPPTSAGSSTAAANSSSAATRDEVPAANEFDFETAVGRTGTAHERDSSPASAKVSSVGGSTHRTKPPPPTPETAPTEASEFDPEASTGSSSSTAASSGSAASKPSRPSSGATSEFGGP